MLNRFEVYTKFRDFKTFHFQQAIAFKRHLAEQKNSQTGKPLSKAILNGMLAHLKRFFHWLTGQPGYKSRLQYSGVEYFSLSEKDKQIATTKREKPVPTLEQIKHVIESMPYDNEIEKRNCALIAFTILTGVRDSAIASMMLKHVDLKEGNVYQDARDVNTKYSKSITTYFFPVGDEIRQIVLDWLMFLRENKLWGNGDPLFLATRVVLGESHRFEVAGLDREYWSSASLIRTIFREVFTKAGLQNFNPHSFRNTLTLFGETRCKTNEEFKAWSQNLGHGGVLVTFNSYGNVSSHRQGEIIRSLTSGV